MILGMLPGLLVSLVLGFFFVSERFSDLNDLLDQRALAMAKQLAPVCEYGVMTGNIAILQNIANNMLEEPDVRSITISNQERMVLAHSGPRMITEQLSDSTVERGQLRLLHTAGSVRVLAPIHAQNLVISDQLSDDFYVDPQPARLLGWAEVELSSANVRLTKYQYLAMAIGIILLVLALGVTVAWRISRQLAIPLSNIRRATEDLIHGKYETRVRVIGGGELSAMAVNMNALAASLQAQRQEQQQTLELVSHDMQETLYELEVRLNEQQIGKREALEAMRMKSEFLTNISHEIRTPLIGIKGYVDLLERTPLNERQRDCLQTMSKSANDLMHMINDLLDLSKLEADKLIFEHAAFNLCDALDDVMGTLNPYALARSLDLSFSIDSQIPENLMGDAHRIKQVLTNLIGNGLKFTRTGGVRVSASLRNQHENQVVLEFQVSDTGIGMSEEERQRLFEPFSQADASTSRQYGGTGLGLLISKALINAMHGEIWVSSTPGQGSTFSFLITVDVNPSQESDLQPLPGLRLIVLSTDDTNDAHLHTLLDRWQIATINCRSTDVLYEMLDEPEIPIDGVILSLQRSCLGTSFCQDLSVRLRPYRQVLITLVNSINHDHMDQLRDYGASTVLSRPVNRRRLHQTLLQHFSDEAGADQETSTTVPNQAPPVVMAVDDNEANLRLVTTLLRDLELRVIPASSGEEAVRLVQEHKIDLIFMDIQMPGMNGLEATREIRSLPDLRHVPVIALTAHAMADEKKMLLNEGMNDYQTKPISLEELAHCVQRWTGYTPQLSRVSKLLTDTDSTASEQPWQKIFSVELALKSASSKADLAVEMLTMLLASLPDEIARIREQWEDDDLISLQATVHKLHGASRYCGAAALRKSLEETETDLKNGNYPDLPERIRTLVSNAETLQRWASENNWREQLLQPTGARRKPVLSD